MKVTPPIKELSIAEEDAKKMIEDDAKENMLNASKAAEMEIEEECLKVTNSEEKAVVKH